MQLYRGRTREIIISRLSGLLFRHYPLFIVVFPWDVILFARVRILYASTIDKIHRAYHINWGTLRVNEDHRLGNRICPPDDPCFMSETRTNRRSSAVDSFAVWPGIYLIEVSKSVSQFNVAEMVNTVV